eukprot:TRINITY_DN3336_c0_g1_i7.p8 TRINITY_DN3336_c0_g1~~TRINITY_DN3336_c0_g1_i7.p8  ORF type:complete len:133 (-),score=2.90 TRINITY_DN3336_c0_g1_i7:847-1245(-)
MLGIQLRQNGYGNIRICMSQQQDKLNGMLICVYVWRKSKILYFLEQLSVPEQLPVLEQLLGSYSRTGDDLNLKLRTTNFCICMLFGSFKLLDKVVFKHKILIKNFMFSTSFPLQGGIERIALLGAIQENTVY